MKQQQWFDLVDRLLGRRNRYQFGQPPETTRLVMGGAVACTDTCIQIIALMARGKRVSLDKVRRLSGAPAGQPMEPDEAIRALAKLGMAYEIRRGLRIDDLFRYTASRGPIILCERYWAHPQWKGSSYLGVPADGKARDDTGRQAFVGFSRPLERSGLTQSTFRDGHAILLARPMGKGERPDADQRAMKLRDPNHNSEARPERPAWDIVSGVQLGRMLRSWPGDSLCLVPSRKLY
jgi:hypothetical protein